jgi:AcrR family transcriptional regulator
MMSEMTEETQPLGTPAEPVRDAEEAIFHAARDVFYEQGFDGARMQEIARRSGMNHSMLHYYYRTKSKLFSAVFRKAALKLMPPVVAVLQSPEPLLQKIDSFVDGYLAMIRSNPHMPAFIIQELRRNPNALKEVVGEATKGVFGSLDAQVKEAVAEGVIRPVETQHLLANLLALCVFPFVARPMLQTALGTSDGEYDAFLDDRNDQIKSFMRNALVP